MKNFVSILLAQRFVSTTGGRTGSLRETKLTRICWTTRISRDIDKTMVVYRLGSCICETVALAEGAAAPPKFVTGQYGMVVRFMFWKGAAASRTPNHKIT